jgi:hypothetical protein
MDEDEAEANKIVQALLADRQMEEVAAYLRLGRPFKEMPEADFKTRWAAAFERVYELEERQYRQQVDDFGAELQLREIEPPVHLVEKTMKIIQQRISDMRVEARDASLEAVRDFIEKMDEPKH